MNGAAVYDFAAGAYRAVEYMPGEEAYRACRLLDRLGAPYAAYAADAILLAGAWEAGNFYEVHFSRCGSRFRHKPVYCRDSADFGGAGDRRPAAPGGSIRGGGGAAGARRPDGGGAAGLVERKLRRPLRRGRFQGRGPAGILPPGGVFPRGDPRAGGRGKRPFHAGNLRHPFVPEGSAISGRLPGRARDRALRAGPARARAQGPLPGGVKNAPPSRSFRGGGVRVLKLSAVPVFAVEGAVLHRLGEVGRADAFGSRRDRRSCAPP